MIFNNQVLRTVITSTLLFALSAGAASADDSLQDFIAAAEATFGGEAYEAGRIGSFAEVQVLSNGELIEALYDGETGALLDSDAFGSPRFVQRIATALDTAAITLPEAITAAENAVGGGEVLEALLQVGRRNSGRRFIVDIRTESGIFDVIVDSATGNVIRIIRD